MARITTKDNEENAIVLPHISPNFWSIKKRGKNTYVICGFAADRLAAYEDTGLTPEEITALIADNKRLHELVDVIEGAVKAF